MPLDKIQKYFLDTKSRPIRDDLSFSAEQLKSGTIAVDCGCGAGADIAYLREQGFTVYAFDIEASAITICRDRFQNDDKVILGQASFIDFKFPTCDLVIADASLFFCPPRDFPGVWKNICDALKPGGIFCGSFLGPQATMANPEHQHENYWPEVSVFNPQDLQEHLLEFETLRFTEHKQSGLDREGRPHDWHIYACVLRKL